MSAISPTTTNASGIATNVNADGTVKTSSAQDTKNEFLSLLVTELKNQDPNNPTDQKETLAQLAQFSSLEETQNLNQNLTTANSFSQMAQSASLIGKSVTAGSISGIVQSVSLTGGKAYLSIGGQSIDAATVTTIK